MHAFQLSNIATGIITLQYIVIQSCLLAIKQHFTLTKIKNSVSIYQF